MAVDLYYREFGEPQAPPLVLLHGLFGSSANWVGIARRLESAYRLIVPDLRNHGRSPHAESMSYPSMAADILRMLDRLDSQGADFIGHSMGGKLAMWLALTRPERVNKLLVADITPVDYPHRFEKIFTGLRAIDLKQLSDRQEADSLLSQVIESAGVRQYLLQNLLKESDGWAWRFNLPVLQREIESLAGFPDSKGLSFPGDVLFVYGGRSDYVKPAYLPAIRETFPLARMRMLAGAGHWVYADQPEQFTQAVTTFLKTGVKM
ncbi:MAG: alpha/beta fold hydrolase [Pseudomonadota bacterium]